MPTTAFFDPSKTPYELWHKQKPEVGHLKVWGCTAYVRKDKQTGIGAHMEKCVFLVIPLDSRIGSSSTLQPTRL